MEMATETAQFSEMRGVWGISKTVTKWKGFQVVSVQTC